MSEALRGLGSRFLILVPSMTFHNLMPSGLGCRKQELREC